MYACDLILGIEILIWELRFLIVLFPDDFLLMFFTYFLLFLSFFQAFSQCSISASLALYKLPNKLWRILRDGNTRPPYLPPEKPVCRSRSSSQNWTWNNDRFHTGKGICQGCILSSCLSNFYVEYIMRNAGLDEAQAGIKIVSRNINNLRYEDDTIPMAEN